MDRAKFFAAVRSPLFAGTQYRKSHDDQNHV